MVILLEENDLRGSIPARLNLLGEPILRCCHFDLDIILSICHIHFKVFLLDEGSGHTKVAELDLAVICHEDILRLNVTMYDVGTINEVEAT